VTAPANATATASAPLLPQPRTNTNATNATSAQPAAEAPKVNSSVLAVAVGVGVSVPLLLTAIATAWYCCITRPKSRAGEVEVVGRAGQPPPRQQRAQPPGATEQQQQQQQGGLPSGFNPAATSAYGAYSSGYCTPPAAPGSVASSSGHAACRSEAGGPSHSHGSGASGAGLQPNGRQGVLQPLVPPAPPGCPSSVHSGSWALPPPPAQLAPGAGGGARAGAPGAPQQHVHSRVGEASHASDDPRLAPGSAPPAPAHTRLMVIGERDTNVDIITLSNSRWR
jgi:hypothetical protein